jgi:hypothetical protein
MTIDCNHNGVSDRADIDKGTSQDANGNDLPDECELGDPPNPSALFHLINFAPALATALILAGGTFLFLSLRRR